MKKSVLFFGQIFIALLTVLPAFAQEVPTATPVPTCSDADKAGIDQCKSACETAVPQCQDVTKPPISLEELRATLAEKCDCSKAKNYGQYESCVKKLMGALREFSMIDKATRVEIAKDSKACRAAIKNRKSSKKPKK